MVHWRSNSEWCVLTSSLTRGMGLFLRRSGMLSMPNGVFPLYRQTHTKIQWSVSMHQCTLSIQHAHIKSVYWPGLGPWVLAGVTILISVLKCNIRGHRLSSLKDWHAFTTVKHAHKHERKGRKYRAGMVEFQDCMPKRTFKSLSIIWFHLVNPYQTTHSPDKHTKYWLLCPYSLFSFDS